MPGKKGSKALNDKYSQLKDLSLKHAQTSQEIVTKELEIHKNEEEISERNEILKEQLSEINNLTNELTEKKEIILSNCVELNKLQGEIKSQSSKLRYKQSKVVDNQVINQDALVKVSSCRLKRRLQKPTGRHLLSLSTIKRRRADTFMVCSAIHGGSKTDSDPTITGMFDTLSSKCSSELVAAKIINIKPSIFKLVRETILTRHSDKYYNSEENSLRSLNVYYCCNVLGKNKYIAIRKANRKIKIPNLIPYAKLAEVIRSVDIGEIFSISGNLDLDISEDEKGGGYYRDLKTYLPRLAQFYLTVDSDRNDKILNFNGKYNKLNPSSILFLFAVGGDEAPLSGTTFLVSFLNVGKRICSSFDNFMIFGGFVKENSAIVKRYVAKLLEEIKYLENNIFTVKANQCDYKIEFKLVLLPNDMKMLAFLAGELSNSAMYFSTFASVTYNDVTCFDKTYGESGDWKPFIYSKRLSDAAAVETLKLQLAKKLLAKQTVRNKVNLFIRQQNSRQEFSPLIGPYIDCAKAEPLHLKNNVCKEVFLKIWNLVIAVAEISSSVKQFNDLHADSLVAICVHHVMKVMKCNKLGKKLKLWFGECITSKNKIDFSFRFRGEESRKYMMGFPGLLSMLLSEISAEKWRFRLIIIFIQSLLLRDIVSYSVRVVDIKAEDISNMKECGRKLFKLCCLHGNVSPSMWTFTMVAPCHAKELFETLGLGLGVNSMEGREQKHQKIRKYMLNSTVQERWKFVFRHEFISLIYLRENRFDHKRYKKKMVSYMAMSNGCCSCSLPLVDDACSICGSNEFHKIWDSL